MRYDIRSGKDIRAIIVPSFDNDKAMEHANHIWNSYVEINSVNKDGVWSETDRPRTKLKVFVDLETPITAGGDSGVVFMKTEDILYRSEWGEFYEDLQRSSENRLYAIRVENITAQDVVVILDYNLFDKWLPILTLNTNKLTVTCCTGMDGIPSVTQIHKQKSLKRYRENLLENL